MKVAILTGGFPSKDNPSKSIFNFRAAKGLQDVATVRVYQLRYWKPGRKLKSEYNYKGVEVTILALPWLPINWGVLNAFNVRLWQWIITVFCCKEIKEYDIIHSIGMETAPIGAYLSKRSKVTHVAQAIGSDILIYLPKIEKYFELSKWKENTKSVICNSAFLSQYININYDICTEVAYRGTNLEIYKPLTSNWSDRRNILFLGGFANRKSSGFGNDLKGGDFLKKLWSAIEKDIPNEYRLIIGGPDSLHEGQKEWRNNLEFPEKVELSGQLLPNVIPDIMRKSKIVLIPSRSEGLPNIGVEALASGCLIIASNVGGIPEIVRHKETGLLLSEFDISTWKSAILQALKSTKGFQDITINARKFVEANFDANNYPRRLLSIYKKYQ